MTAWDVSNGAKYFSCEWYYRHMQDRGLTTTILFLRRDHYVRNHIIFLPATMLPPIVFATFLSLATAPPIFAWLSDLSPHDAEQRAFILGWSECMETSLQKDGR